MDFKSHEEVILPPEKAAKKSAQENAQGKLPGSRPTEIRIPAARENVSRAAASMGAPQDAPGTPPAPVREVQISSGTPNVQEATAPSAPAEQKERVEIEPRVLNAGLKLLRGASRQGSPGGRLIRSSQLSSAAVQNERPAPRQPARSAKQVKVEPLSKIEFPEDSVAEVASLQAPPPVELPPGQKAIDSREFDGPVEPNPKRTVERPAQQHVEQPVERPKAEPKPPLEIDSRQFAQELDLPEYDNRPLEIDSKEFARELDLPEPEPAGPGSGEPARQNEAPAVAPPSASFATPAEQKLPSAPKMEPSGASEPKSVQSPGATEPRIVQKFGSKVIRKIKSDSKVIRKVKPPEQAVPEPAVPEPAVPGPTVTGPTVAAPKVAAPPAPPPTPVARDATRVPEQRNLPEPEAMVVVELGKAELVWEPPEADDAERSTRSSGGKAGSASLNQKPYRDFIIAYDGAFIGHFRSRKRITNRTAFQQVARRLHTTTTSFDVRKLKLFRPVPIDVDVPETLPGITDGAFMWFSDSPTKSSDSE